MTLQQWRLALRPVLAGLILLASSAQAVQGNSDVRHRVAPHYEQLLARAEQRGHVRVIARYRTDNPHPFSQARQHAAQSLRNFLTGRGLQRLKKLHWLPIEVYELNSAQLDMLLDSGLVELVVEDRLNEPQLQGSIPYLGGDIAHNFGLTGNGTSVAILDTGVEASHPAFGGRVVEEACFSTSYAPFGVTSLCPNGTTTQTGPGAAAPCADLCSHGTHVADIAAGSTSGAPGVAPDATIIAIQVFSHFSRDNECGDNRSPCLLAYDSDLLEALDHVKSLTATYNIASLNMSLAGGKYTEPCTTSYFTAYFDELMDLGVLPVAASGNYSYTDAIGSPACSPSAMSVGYISDHNSQIESRSNSATFLDILAPGRSIRAAIPDGRYSGKTGSSMAAPHVAGAAALVRADSPGLSAAEIRSLLTTEASTILDNRNGLSFPSLNLELVTRSLAGPGEMPEVSITAPENGAVIGLDDGPINLVASASDPQDGDVSASITWSSDLDGTVQSPASLSAGQHLLQATATDSVGFSTSASVTVDVVNKPTVTILAPAAGTTILQGIEIALSASASDVEDGDLSGALTWSSSLDGTVASGASASVILSPGTHTLTATVTDSDGHAPGSAPQREITVQWDHDGDGIASVEDNCPMTPNPDQTDTSGNGKGDVCDTPDGC